MWLLPGTGKSQGSPRMREHACGLTMPLRKMFSLCSQSSAGRDGSHDPPCGPRRLLCLGRAAARPVAARQADRRRRRRRAGRLLRSQSLRRRRRHAGTAGARALPAAHLSSAAISRSTSGWATPRSRCSAISRRSSSGSRSTRRLPMSRAARISSARPPRLRAAIRRRVRAELGLPISVGVARTKHLAKIASQVAKPDGLVVVDPATELDFLHDLPVELMWGVGPVTKARLAEIGVHTIGQLAQDPGMVARAAARPRGGREARRAGLESRSAEIKTHRRAQIGRRAVGARQEAGAKRTSSGPTLRHLADRIGTRLRAKSLSGRTVTVRVRFADLHAVTRAVTLDAPISATATLAEIAEDLVRGVLARSSATSGRSRCWRSRCRISRRPRNAARSALGLEDEARRPGSREAWRVARPTAPSTGSATLRMGSGRLRIGRFGTRRSVPDDFRELAERDL